MKDTGRLFWLAVGLVFGVVGSALFFAPPAPVSAANDRFDDYVMCTGTASSTLSGGGRALIPSPTDGVWLLDYRSGKLLGTVIDRTSGKITGWAEVDLVTEFGIPPRQNVHFLMTTGNINYNQAALYVAETMTGKFGVYTMSARTDNQPGVTIQRHDLVMFRPGARAN